MKKAKPVNIKHVKQTGLEPYFYPDKSRQGGWFKCAVFFKNRVECKNFSMPLAIKLRTHCPNVYFARYCDATQSRADFIFELPEPTTANFARSVLNHLEHRQFKASEPFPCEGSLAHARGFDAVMEIWAKTYAQAADTESEYDLETAQHTAFDTIADVHHWMANMLGFDYTDEGHICLFGLGRIMNIFAESITRGNKLSEATKAVTQKKAKIERN